MLRNSKAVRVCSVAVATGVMVTSLAACGSDDNGSGGDGEAITTINFWDPYPQYEADSDWAKYVDACAPDGTTIKRTAAPQNDLFNNLTNAVKAGNPPDVALLDNPLVPDAASAGLLAPADDTGMDTSGFDENLAAPGTVDGVTYGVPVGVNTLGLYYNKDILDKAGVDPAGITDWPALEDALQKVTASGAKGITFSGIAGEEGVFQFLPWFWGAGASLEEPSSAAAADAGAFVSKLVGEGWAPKSAATDNQSASWDLFLTGDYAFAENGSWFAGAAADLTDFSAGVVPLPSKDGGAAPAPTGGEFVVAPMQKENAQAHYDAATQVISCLVGKDNQVKTDDALGYFAANGELRKEQIAANPAYTAWSESVDAAEGRTSDLGPGYTAVSASISEALQTALNAAGDEAKAKEAFTSIETP